MMTSKEKFLARRLFEIGAIQFGAFRLKLHEKNPDAPLSPIYLNLRTPENPNKSGPLDQELVDEIGCYLYGVACTKRLYYNCVAGIPYAGDPFANAFSKAPSAGFTIPVFRFVKEGVAGDRRIGGVKESIRTTWMPIPIALLIDDLITEADSKIEAIREARKAGYIVRDVLVLVDREQGGKEELEKIGVRLHAGFTLTVLLEYYVEEGMITEEKRKEVLGYLFAS